MEIIKDGVHATHCCSHHGCKYGAEDCPIEKGRIPALYECEFCTFPSRDTDALERWSEQDRVRLAKEQVEVIVANTVHTMCEWIRREIEETEARAQRQLEGRNYEGFMLAKLRAQHYAALLTGMQDGKWKA